jgi:hypothetical protein
MTFYSNRADIRGTHQHGVKMKHIIRCILASLATAALAADTPIGLISRDPLTALGLHRSQLRNAPARPDVRFVKKTQYLNNCRAVITHHGRFRETCASNGDSPAPEVCLAEP